MALSRLTTAIDDGLIDLAAGQTVQVMRPAFPYDLSALSTQQVSVVHTSFPESENWKAAGLDVSQSLTDGDVAIVGVPRSKSLARAMVAQAATYARLVIVDGQKTDGVDSLFKACRSKLGALPSITKSHGRLFWFTASDVFSDWASSGPVRAVDGWFTQPGVFSDGAIDQGSRLLAEALPEKLPKRMADLGAGWGYLSAAALDRAGVESIELIEAEALSLACARKNIADERARFVWGDATRSEGQFDGIVMNPPFHQGRTADIALGKAFIAAAARLLTPQGQMWMVANRHLPYEDTLEAHFRQVSTIPGNSGFKIFHTARPR